jgi:RND family efflux transporter MFP subunit
MMPRLFATVVLIACYGLLACGSKESAVDVSKPSEGPLVQSIVAEGKSRPVFEEVVGSVRAKSVASIEAKVSGRIAKMHVDLGQRVAKDQLLAEIDAKEVKAQYDRAVANRDQAQRDYKRFADLLQKQITSRQEFDAVEARFRVAEAALREAESMLGYVEVRSPFDGVVVRKLADTGDFAAPGKPILQIENPEKLRFEADVPEALIDTVRSGARVDVLISSLSGPLHGTVSDISPTADPVSRTFLVRVELPGEKGCKAGQFGRALFPTGNYSSIGVTSSAVVLRGQMEMVFIDDGGRARLRLVKTGKRFGDEVELISGVATGERIITEHAQDLNDGQAIRPAP